MTTDHDLTSLDFIVDGVPTGTIVPWEAVGTEAISQLYSFDVACVLKGDPPETAAVIGKAAKSEVQARAQRGAGLSRDG